MSNNRYFWLKLKDDFFTEPAIKKLRKVAGGDTYTIIYLKLQLLSLKTDGIIEFTGLEDDFISELSLVMDEKAENISFLLLFLKRIGWLIEEDGDMFYLPETAKNIGSETQAAERMRKSRSKSVTMLQKCSDELQNCSTDIDIDKDIDIDSFSMPTETVDTTEKKLNKFDHQSIEYKIAIAVKSHIKNLNHSTLDPTESTMQKWADSARLMLERDGRSIEQIRTVMKFAFNDDFWKTNILSVPKLRKQFDNLLIKANARKTINEKEKGKGISSYPSLNDRR